MKLSILIPSLIESNYFYKRILSQIKNQLTLLPIFDSEIRPFNNKNYDFFRFVFEEFVEVIILVDEKQNTIGYKRNELLKYASGEYVAFVDVDDRINENYFSLLLAAIETKPDCCSLNGIITTDGCNPKYFTHSLRYKNWYEESNIYYRPPNHLNCIKSSIAKAFIFPNLSNGEDKDWSMQIAESGLLKTEYEIQETIYFYDYISNK